LNIFRISVKKVQFSLKLDQNKGTVYDDVEKNFTSSLDREENEPFSSWILCLFTRIIKYFREDL
jgi:hypothetical protein